MPDPALSSFLAIFTLLEARQDTTTKMRLERIVTLLLGEMPSVLVCLKHPEPQIRVLWETHFVTLVFVRPAPEDRKVPALAKYIRLFHILASVAMLP